MSGFSISWLDLREGADFVARDKLLAKQALTWLATNADDISTDQIVVDLGSGTGSTLRALTSLGARNIVWRLVDHDGALLNEALQRHGKECLIEDYQADLTIINELPLRGARLVTASALFDLASQDFVDRIINQLNQNHAGLYAALNYDGTTEWTPPHPLDAVVLAAFNQDQRRDKGFGPALGPESASYLQTTLRSADFHVFTRPSPWQLGPADHLLVSELIRGIANAVASDYGLDADALTDWQTFRLAHAASGHCTVGHVDVLALPVTGN